MLEKDIAAGGIALNILTIALTISCLSLKFDLVITNSYSIDTTYNFIFESYVSLIAL
tara:strand:- start:82 stop:252 length:171 start_codon:yes stop_codon:yes gene_type:complete